MSRTFPARYEREFDEFLRELVSAEHPELLYRMVRYHLGWETAEGEPADFPGKLLRPAFCLLSCESLSEQWEQCVPAAAALELVHNFSLVHDDIQDQDTERHHRPTVWSVWGPAQAINAGDSLLALAHEALGRLSERGLPSERILAAVRTLDRRTLEMVEGQVLDIGFEDSLDVSLEAYLEMIEKKTGALFDCAFSLGAIVAGADERTVEAFGRCGRLLGIAFQLRDDMLGVWGEGSRTGKGVGADIRRRKKSLPVMYALSSSDSAAREELRRIYEKAELSDDDVAAVLRILDETGAEAYCAGLAEEKHAAAFADSAIMRLENAAIAELRETAAFLLERDF